MEIYLLIGQSNMAGRGIMETQDRTIHPRVWALSEQQNWVPALEPLHFDKPEIAGVGPGLRFGKLMAEAKPDAQIGLVPRAFGGTSLDEWKPEGALFNEAVRSCKTAMQSGELKGILWHQGENDIEAGQQAEYLEKLECLLGALREALGKRDIPFVIGEIGHFFQDADSLNRLLPQIIAKVPDTHLILADGLNHDGDEVHFNAASARQLGERYAIAFRGFEQIQSNGISDNR